MSSTFKYCSQNVELFFLETVVFYIYTVDYNLPIDMDGRVSPSFLLSLDVKFIKDLLLLCPELGSILSADICVCQVSFALFFLYLWDQSAIAYLRGLESNTPQRREKIKILHLPGYLCAS